MQTNQARLIVYWLATASIALETFVGGVMDLTHGRTAVVSGPPVADVVTSLGYPLYLLAILGVYKVLGAMVVVAPGLLRLKEWAYAGIVFELSGAVASQLASGHPTDGIAPAILLGVALVSWGLRPQSRVLAGRA